jgi:Aminopeptidase N
LQYKRVGGCSSGRIIEAIANARTIACFLFFAQILPAAPQFLLPEAAGPRRYAIDLTILPGYSTFGGVATIDLDLKQKLSVLWLNGKDLKVDSAILHFQDSHLPARVAAARGEFLGFDLPQAVGPGPARLEIRYRGRLSETATTGVFRKRSAGDWYVFTTFAAIEARRAFPCFDEPRYKTPWELTLHVGREQKALANTRAISEMAEPGGMKRVVFAPTVPLPSYLVAFAVGPFDIVDAGRAGKNGVLVRIITPRGLAAGADAARAATPQLLARLEEYTGIPYPFDKLDHLALIAGAFGAIENPGLITYRQRVLLVPENDQARRLSMRGTMAHELAHQWFGNLVTMRGWEDVWLSEGFATWMGTKLMDEEQPPERRKVQPVSARNRIMAVDELSGARKVREPMTSREQMRRVYGPVVYQKGAAILGMLEQWLGEDAMRVGIRRYLTAHQFASVTTADFAAAVSSAAGRDIHGVLDSFLDRAGVPVVRAELQCDGLAASQVTLHQDRYLPLGAPPDATTWSVPVCLKAEGVAGRCFVLESREMVAPLPACPSWMLVNAGASGYYRTLLRPSLFTAAQSTAAERLTFAQDVAALVMNGDCRRRKRSRCCLEWLTIASRWSFSRRRIWRERWPG